MSPRLAALCLLGAACGAAPGARGEAPHAASPVALDAGEADTSGSPTVPGDAGGGAVVDGGAPDAGMRDAGAVDGGPAKATFWVLFDAAHKNAAGNADWVVDDQAPAPSPSHPTAETRWSGGISAWGFDLHSSGRYEIRQLPAGSPLSFGGGGPGDLSGFDVFVSDEPEEPFGDAEQAALLQFAQAGGGVFLVADHAGAKRCASCTEAWRVINALLVTGRAADAWGVRCDGNTIGQGGLNGAATAAPAAARLTSGPFGPASLLSFHSGTSVSVTGANPQAAVVVRSGAAGMLATSQLPSGGRLVLLGDSSPTDDGTCTNCGATLYDGWGEVDNARFILNATAWLAHDGS